MSTIPEKLATLVEALQAGDSSRLSELSNYQPDLIAAALQGGGLDIDGDGNIVGKTIRTGDGNIIGSHNVMISLKTELPHLAEQLVKVSAELESHSKEISRLEKTISAIQAERRQVEQVDTKKLPITRVTTAWGSRNIFQHLLLSILLGLAIFLLFCIPYIRIIELKTLDWKFKTRQIYNKFATKGQITLKKEKVIIIALGDDFLEDEMISRKKLARLIADVSKKTPKVIGIDILLEQSKEGDEELVQAIEAAGNVVIPFALQAESPGQSPEMLFPLPKFRDHAGIGFANFGQHPIDGVVRELQSLEIKEGGALYYPFALQILLHFHAVADMEEILEGNPEHTRLLRINFDKEDQFIVLTPEDLQSPLFKDFYYEDKIVLIGYRGEKQQYDMFLTPLSVGDQKMKGVFIHANILNTIIRKRYLRSWRGLDILLVLLLAFAGGYFFPKPGWIIKSLILSGIWVFYIIVALLLFLNTVDIPLWTPMITITLTAFLPLRKSM